MPHLISVQTMEIIDQFGIDEGFKMIHDAGFDGVDFNFTDPAWNFKRFERKSAFDQSDEAICEAYRPYKEAAEKYNVRILQMHAHAPGWSPNDSAETDDYVIHVHEKTIMLCSYLGCSHLIVHPFFPDYRLTVNAEQEWDANIRMYSRLIPAAKKYGVTICLENMFTVFKGKIYSSLCQEPEEVNRYIDTLNEIAGEKVFAFCLDTGHSLLVGKDILRVIQQIGHRIERLHIHDNDGWDDQHLAPYFGRLDWNRFMLGMKEIGYREPLSFETSPTLKAYDRELTPEVLALISATGRMFSRRIEAE